MCRFALCLALVIPFSLTGCVLAPRGTVEERARVAAAGEVYEQPRAARMAPELPAAPTWRELLQRAFLVNGDLEAAYLDWRAAVLRIDRAAGYPNTNVSLGYEYLFSGDNLKAWDRTTLSIGFDPMQNLSLPPKVLAAGRVALAEARTAGRRFAAAKFALQQRVLTAYLDSALLAEQTRLQAEAAALLDVATASARGRVQTGGEQGALLQAEAESRLARNELQRLEAEQMQAAALLNALVGRDARAPLLLPLALPAPRSAPDDTHLLTIGVADNPVLAALAHEVRGRTDALRLARLQYFPDLNPFAGLTGSIEQFVGVAVTLATTIPQIRAGIAEAKVMLRRGEVMQAQTGLDLGASFVATLAAMRDAERQAAVLDEQILPIIRLRAAIARQTYATGSLPLAELIETERAAIDLRSLIAEQRIRREKKLAELEALAGVDIETLAQAQAATHGHPLSYPPPLRVSINANAPFETAPEMRSLLRVSGNDARTSPPVRALCERGQEGAEW